MLMSYLILHYFNIWLLIASDEIFIKHFITRGYNTLNFSSSYYSFYNFKIIKIWWNASKRHFKLNAVFALVFKSYLQHLTSSSF